MLEISCHGSIMFVKVCGHLPLAVTIQYDNTRILKTYFETFEHFWGVKSYIILILLNSLHAWNVFIIFCVCSKCSKSSNTKK